VVSFRALMTRRMADDVHRMLPFSMTGKDLEMDHKIKVNAAENKESDFPASLGIWPSSVGSDMNTSTTKNLYVILPRA
jgi:hypothetical protein